ncbi:MAG: response regulator [Deltaproteobacteria bacterium]|nr:response regulator [Deltaproteobacteria bacterium]MBI2209778.1 response regulator [Deltaproteobacteria bacterium]MBI2991280.1 response regulator [Deltaproteobacteria bacterium]
MPRSDRLPRTILVADGNPDCRELLSVYLKRLNYPAPIEAADGEEAVRKVLIEKPDLIIMEIFLPKKDGLEVAAQLRANPLTRDAMLVAATAMVLPDGRERCLAGGFDAYLAKPFTMRELGDLLRTIFSPDASPDRP